MLAPSDKIIFGLVLLLVIGSGWALYSSNNVLEDVVEEEEEILIEEEDEEVKVLLLEDYPLGFAETESIEGDSKNEASSGASALLTHQTYLVFSDDLTFFSDGFLIEERASVPDVLVKGDEIWVYYVDADTAHQGDGLNIGYVMSADGGETWTDRQWVEIKGVEDDVEPVDPSLFLMEDGTVRLYYYDFPYGGVQQATSDFYVASSDDGISFEIDQMALSIGNGHTDPDVIKRGDDWFMYYAATGVDGGARIGVALSDDGLTFEDQGYVESEDLKSIPTAIVMDDGRIRLYSCLSNSGISFDGVSFITDTDSVLNGGGCDPSVDRYDGGYVMAYKLFNAVEPVIDPKKMSDSVK